MNAAPDLSKRVQSLEAGFHILKTMAEHSGPMTLSELAKETGLHKSQLYRYLNSFVYLGVLQKENEGENARWTFGTELIVLGNRALQSMDVGREAGPFLIRLRNELNENVGLSVWQGDAPYFVKFERSRQPIHIGLHSFRIPLSTTTGKLFRAFLPEQITRRQYEEMFREEPLLDRGVYDRDIDAIRKSGYAIEESSYSPGIVVITVPVFGPDGSMSAALSVLGVSEMFDDERRFQTLQQLLSAAEEISRRIGYTGPYPAGRGASGS